jgi:N-formylmaleamate deformylase
MSNWADGYITSNGLKLHYYRTGGDKPKVVFNHGAMDDGLCWTRIVKVLEKDYDVIMTDARGHGKSASGNGDYSSQSRATDLAGLIQALQLDRPVVGGHSLGADTSIHLAAQYPNLVRGIFLEDPPIVMPGEPVFGGEQMANSKEDVGKMMARFMRTFRLYPRFIGIRLARKAFPTYPDDELNPWVDSKKRMSADFLNAMLSLKMGGDEIFGALQKIVSPILLMIGDKEKGSIVSQAGAEKAVQVNPRVKVAHFEGANHDIRRFAFADYVRTLQDFLADMYLS